MAIRPWTYTAALVPIALGAALAYYEGKFHAVLFALTLIAGIFIQAGANLFNTYGDYASGVDLHASPDDSRSPIVKGQLSADTIKYAAFGTLAISGAIGLYLAYVTGWPVLAIGMVGVAGAYGYTRGLIPYKYIGMGSPLVFFLMGPMMVWPAYYIQTEQFSLRPIWISIPISFLVSAILHANEFRDQPEDAAAGIRTFALILGNRGSLIFLYFLNIAAFVSLIALCALHQAPITSLLPVLMIPVVVKLLTDATAGYRGDTSRLIGLAILSGKTHFLFGALFVIGVAIGRFVH
jgi:1,4-dihydroxy-2-naphthoate octaprenyltransferase